MRVYTFRVFVLMLATITVLNSCGGKGGGLPQDRDGASLEKGVSDFRLISLVDESQTGTGQLEMMVGTEDSLVTVDLLIAKDQEISQLIYHLEYDSNELFFMEAELSDCLGSESEKISLIYGAQSGIVAIAEARFGLEPKELAAGELFATLRFSLDSGKGASAATVFDRGLPGMKLRNNVEFINEDVPFSYVHVSPDDPITVTWEEANDGDFDHNGEVNAADITQIAIHDKTIFSKGDEYSGNSQATSRLDIQSNTTITRRNISLDGDIASGHTSVAKTEVGAQAPPWDSNFCCDVSTADLAQIAKNYFHAVHGYDIYVVSCPTDKTPADGNWMEEILVGEVVRPTTEIPNLFMQKIKNLGMGEFNNHLNVPEFLGIIYLYDPSNCAIIIVR